MGTEVHKICDRSVRSVSRACERTVRETLLVIQQKGSAIPFFFCAVSNAAAIAPLADGNDAITLKKGESVSRIVERLVPNNPNLYILTLREVVELNRARFPDGKAERASVGFRLELPQGLLAKNGGEWVPTINASTSVAAAVSAGKVNVANSPDSTAKARANKATDADKTDAFAGDTLTVVAARVAAERGLDAPKTLVEIKRLNPRTAAEFSGNRPFQSEQKLFINSAWFAPKSSASDVTRADNNASAAPTNRVAASSAEMPIKPAVSGPANRTSDGTVNVQNGNDKSNVSTPAPSESIIAADVQVQSLNRVEAEQERLRALMAGRPAAYVDKVMDQSTLPAQTDASADKLDLKDAGLRTYFVESRLGFADSVTTNQGSARATEFGVRSEYRYETLNYGELVAQLDARTRAGDQVGVGSISSANLKTSERVTLRDIGLPITNNVFADVALGDIGSEVTDALGRSYRLSLGSSTVRGISTQIFSQAMDLRFGVGLRGLPIGTPYPGFERSEGMLGWLGYSHRFGSNYFAGVQLGQARKIPAQFSQSSQGATIDSASSVAVSAGRSYGLADDGDYKARVTLLASRTSAAPVDQNLTAKGIFVESGLILRGYRNEFGLYSSDANLYFSDAPLTGDSRGAYWRVDRDRARWKWGASIDYEQQNPTHAPGRLALNRYGLSGNVIYRIDRNSSAGANLNISETRYADVAATALNATGSGTNIYSMSAFYQTRFDDWGRSRFTVSARRNQVIVANGLPASGEQIDWEHDWITGKYETLKPELTTTLGVARDHSATGVTELSPTVALLLRYWVSADWTVGGNLRYSSRSGNLSTSRGLSGTLNSEYTLDSNWRVGFAASINEANIQINTNGAFGPTTVTGPIINRSSDKSAYVYIRYEGSRGSPFQTLGLKGAGSAGAGNIRGIVYFDANRDGERQADERGAPGVEVSLDGRYRTLTNAEGRFEFPVVATGDHRLTVKLETVPLPWGAALESGLKIEVPLRGTVDARIPVVRTGD